MTTGTRTERLARAWTKERLAEAKARCEAATPGPWGWTPGSGDAEDADECACVQSADGSMEIEAGDKEPSFFRDADAAFIAAARTDLPDALTEIERLRAELAARPAPAADASLEARAFGPHDAAAMASDLIGESRGLAEDDPRRGARLAASLMGLWLRAVDASRPWHPTPERAATVIAFLRGNFFNDGAEGESVHLVCDMLETALARRPGLTDSTAELARVLAHVATLPAWCAPTPPHGMRPAALGGECARCLARPGYHEESCVRRLARGLTEEQALRWADDIAARVIRDARPDIRLHRMYADALLRASRGEVPPVPANTTEGLGPELGILAPAASDAARAGHVLIPRAALIRLVEATCYEPNVRVEREIARTILHLDLLRHEPARTDPDAARAATKRGGQ